MMMKLLAPMKLRALALVASLLCSGCYTTTLKNASHRYDGRGTRHQVVVNNIFWGLESIGEVDLEQYCTKNATEVSEIRVRTSALGVVVQVFTLGFYTPLTVRITCTAPVPMVGGQPRETRPELSYELVPVNQEHVGHADSRPSAPPPPPFEGPTPTSDDNPY